MVGQLKAIALRRCPIFPDNLFCFFIKKRGTYIVIAKDFDGFYIQLFGGLFKRRVDIRKGLAFRCATVRAALLRDSGRVSVSVSAGYASLSHHYHTTP